MSVMKTINNNLIQVDRSYGNSSYLGLPQPIEIAKTSNGLDIKPIEGGGIGYGLGNAMRLGFDYSYLKISNLCQTIIKHTPRFPLFDIPTAFAKDIPDKILSKSTFEKKEDKSILSKQSCQMSEVGKLQSLPGLVGNIVVSEQYAFITLHDNYQGLEIVDVRDPSNPTPIKDLKIPSFSAKVAISGYYAYVVDGNKNFFVIDIKDPSNAFITGQCFTNPSPINIAIQGNYAYVVEGVGTAGIGGLQIIDIGNASKPTIIGSCSIEGQVNGVKVLGNYAYVTYMTYHNAFLGIINIKNPSNPVLVNSYKMNMDSIYGIKVLGNYAYLVTGSKGLQIINVDNPTNPVFAGSYNRTNTYFFDVDVNKENAYLANSEGVDVIDIKNPANPILKGHYNKTVSGTGNIAVLGNYSFVSSRDPLTDNSSLHVIKVIC